MYIPFTFGKYTSTCIHSTLGW